MHPLPTDLGEILTALAWLPTPTYVVGGAVRDHLLGRRRSTWDVDLIVEEEGLTWGSRLAKAWGGGFVALDPQRQIARVVLPNLTVDVATLVGGSLDNDLRQRDFTCNAMAMEIHDQQLRDPLNGHQDLAQRQLRMVHPDNLSADPLRLLRGYRHTAQLGFHLTPETQAAIQERAALLSHVAGERVRAELIYMLACGQQGLEALAKADRDGVMAGWLPRLSHWPMAERMLRWYPELANLWPEASQRLDTPLADTRPLWQVLLLLALLHDQAPAQIEQQLLALHFSRLERQWCQKIAVTLPQFLTLVTTQPSPEDAYDIFAKVGTALPGLLWLALGQEVMLTDLHPWMERFRDPDDPIAHAVPLLSGQEVMQTLGIPPSPQVGSLLRQLVLAQVRREISTRSQAQTWLRAQVQQQDPLHGRG
ncbi:MAG: CCA tRNA nucleotidyltransferase [Synechococcales cyanobacterium]